MHPGKINKIVAAVIFVVMLVIYLMTVAPTISFWDCGEFVACSYIVGIPHPPGSPLLSLIGRVMSLIPFHDFRGYGIGEIGYRVTLIDVLLGALTVMLTYIIVVKLIHKLRPATDRLLDESVVMFSAAVTAFMVGFSDEFWNNAVEIETYMPSIFMSIFCVWLVLRWNELKDDPGEVKYLFLASYILGLGNGVHLTVLLIAPTVFLLILLSKPEWFASPKLWISGIVFLLGIAMIKAYASLDILYFFMAVFAFIAPAIIYKMYSMQSEMWKVTFLGMILCFSLYIIGYSVYPTVMVRANKKPAINEGNPDNWPRYKLYMERDQYGQDSMVKAMFTRNADFKYQFGFMYMRYLIQQFPKWGPTVPLTFENNKTPESRAEEDGVISHKVYLSVFLVSILLYGLYTHVREDWKRCVSLVLFFIASSVGLILYLNMENPQVRERSYFFLGSFQIIMVWIGIGIFGVIMDIIEWIREKGKPGLTVPVTTILFVIFGTLPPVAVLSNHIDPDFSNYGAHDRTRDWAPRDYGYNILTSCEKDAILFTNGDNDTFPLWYLQEVEGFRKDVRVINLSLLNTSWYILQMKYEGKTIPIEYSDDHIENVLCGREESALRKRLWPAKGKEVTAAGITWTLPANILYSEETGMIRVQDVMTANIIQWVNWSRPIYFAVTVAEANKAGLQDYLSMEGMVYRLVKTKAKPGESLINAEVLNENVFEKYRYHELSDPGVYKPPNTLKLVTNYFIGFAQLAERYASRGDSENAIRASIGAIEKTPNDLGKRLLLYQVLASNKMYDELRDFLERETSSEKFLSGNEGSLNDRLKTAVFMKIVGEKQKVDSIVKMEMERLNLDSFDLQYRFGAKLLDLTLYEQVYDYFNDLVIEHPDNVKLWEMLTAAMYVTGRYDEALETADKLLEIEPNDKAAQQTRDLINQLINNKIKGDSLDLRIKQK